MNYLCPQFVLCYEFCKNCTCTQEAHTRTHARTCLRLRNTFVYGMTSLLFEQVSEVDETLFPCFSQSSHIHTG